MRIERRHFGRIEGVGLVKIDGFGETVIHRKHVFIAGRTNRAGVVGVDGELDRADIAKKYTAHLILQKNFKK